MFVQCTSTTNQLYIKAAKHSFQVPMPNLPLLLNYLCFGARFLQVSRLTTEGFTLIFWLRRGWLKTRLKNGFCLFTENPVVRYFFIICTQQIDIKINPFCQHYSNKILT